MAALAHVLAGCAISLDGEPSPGTTGPDAGVPSLAGCTLFRDEARNLASTGRVRSLALDGKTLFVVDALRFTANQAPTIIEHAVFEATMPDSTTCLGGVPSMLPVRSGLDASALGQGTSARILSIFVVGTRRLAYVQAFEGFEPVGIALAEWDEAAGVFVAGGEYLFTGDRPEYGDAALVVDSTVYVYGCRTAGFLSDACYVARVAAERVHDRTAYEFYRDGGSFGSNPDDAWPIFLGGRGLAIASKGDRVYAAYATPLGRTLHVRSGLGPSGPWSAAVQVTQCELPAASAFCGAVSAHPLLDEAPDSLALSYSIASFDPLPGDASSSRLVIVPLTALPAAALGHALR